MSRHPAEIVADQRLGEILAQLRVPEGGFKQQRSSPKPAPVVSQQQQQQQQQRKITAALVGAGNRGGTYTTFALENPDLIQIVAVADPNPVRRERLQAEHSIPASHAFSSWQELASLERQADAVLICTQDQEHLEPAVQFAGRKYHILLEKPMATTEEDCLAIYEACVRNDVMLAVCHVLRYTPYMSLMRSLIEDGAVGKVMNIQHLEPVGWYHHAHSCEHDNQPKPLAVLGSYSRPLMLPGHCTCT